VLKFLRAEAGETLGSLLIKRRVDDLHLGILELLDTVFDGLGDKDAIHVDLAGLRHAMSPVDGLFFDERVPERVKDDDTRGLPEVETSVASLDGH
jgi:hypothetical protein